MPGLGGVPSPGCLVETPTPRTATAAGGMHPTGMHSCLLPLINLLRPIHCVECRFETTVLKRHNDKPRIVSSSQSDIHTERKDIYPLNNLLSRYDAFTFCTG